MKLKVYPTSRSLSESLKEFNDTFLEKYITFGEFEQRAVVVKDKKMIDQDKRVLFLKKAVDFKEFKHLKIPTEYLSFLNSSKLLFAFFDELSLEKVKIDDILISDTYAEYSDHLEILKRVLHNYVAILESNGYYDKITLPLKYEINRDYLKRFDNVELYIDGYLSRFEFELIKKVSMIKPLFIYYQTNNFTKKMIDRFAEFGLELEPFRKYLIDISNSKILKSEKLPENIDKIYLHKTSSRTLQIGYVKKKIYDFVKEGIEPNNIVVITPDEEFNDILKVFDNEHMFNFAAGFSFGSTNLFKKIEALYLYLVEPNSLENRYRIERLFKERIEINKFVSKVNNYNEFCDKVLNLCNEENRDEIKVLKKELFELRPIFEELKGKVFKDILHLFLQRLKENRLDDVGGGKITVMGVLESRLMEYEGVVVVDFDEQRVPKISSNDMFLNTVVRKKAKLPTIKDRENLQKNYYLKLFSNAKRVAISSVENESQKVSKFLDEMNIKEVIFEDFDEKSIKNIFIKESWRSNKEQNIAIKERFNPQKFTFTASSLKKFLECKRAFYYRYIKGIKDYEIPSKELNERELGNLIHKALYDLFDKKDSYQNKKEMIDKLFSYLKVNTEDLPSQLKVDMLKLKLEDFIKNDIDRFAQGFKVYKRELKLNGEFEGIKISGIIDRIDLKDAKYYLLDYKSGKIALYNEKNVKNATDFQMEFYYMLAIQNGFENIGGVGFYDINLAKIIEENLLNQKIQILKDIFNSFKDDVYEFDKTKEKKVCRYCPYAILCKEE